MRCSRVARPIMSDIAGIDSKAERKLVVVGASAGGVTALRKLVSDLPADFPAPVLIVLHIGSHPSMLPALLSSAGPLPAVEVEDGSPLVPGRVGVAPPDHHLLVDQNTVRLSRGPKEHHTRPAIDPLFRSAALAHGSRVIGVVLTGHLDDGTAGLQAIKACGGIAVVQDPRDAQEPSMPLSAMHHVDVDHCLPIDAIGKALTRLVKERTLPKAASVPAGLSHEHALSVAPPSEAAMEHLEAIADPSTLACPDCGGTLWEIRHARPARFRCHTGHAYTLRTLAHSMSGTTEHALQAALRALQEQAILLRKAARSIRESGSADEAIAIEAGAVHAEDQARTLRQLTERPPMRPVERDLAAGD